jgi:hypothetical protein
MYFWPAGITRKQVQAVCDSAVLVALSEPLIVSNDWSHQQHCLQINPLQVSPV